MEKSKQYGDIKAEMIRNRNKEIVYKDGVVQKYEEMIKFIDAENTPSYEKVKRLASEEYLNEIDKISLKDPSEMEKVPSSKKSQRMNTQRDNKVDLFTTEEIK